ncbi:MAG: thrombospondin type 3 repeat-containing protein, partial [Alcanivoracaceae bacterium]|jgi:hypothetical protein|nr:thrombospondin type 3 repeat-containing protein [Alcanivoracaceae bacterium]
VSNADQLDSDGDGLGDACDSDRDGDGVDNAVDNCPQVSNQAQTDTDNDSVGNACDVDSDADGVADAVDNCPLLANADQADVDGDGIGDICDTGFSCTASSAYPALLASNGVQITSGTTGGILCLLCSGSNAERVIDDDGASAADMSTAATLSTPVALLGGSAYFDITSPVPINGDNRVGFVLSESGSLLSLALLEGTTISLFLAETEVDRFEGSTLTDLDLLGLLAEPAPAFVSADTSATFDRVRIEFSAQLGALSTLNVHASCVGPTP